MKAPSKSKPNKSRWDNLILHLHPKKVPEQALVFKQTFGLGGMAALLFVLLAFTGVLLRFAYTPTPGQAYESILGLKGNIVFGNLVRNLHYWSATLLVVISFLHLLRVFYTGAYYGKRGGNWIIGVCLLFLVVLSNFTGYLLPWDQLSYWAITVSANMLNYVPHIGPFLRQVILQGNEVNPATLLAFYNMHTSILPLALVILMSFHFWKIRKAGGIAIPKSKSEKTIKVSTIPNLVSRELTAALSLIVFLLLLSVFVNAPLGEHANPDVTPNPSKAPWYFMGFQELIMHFHPSIAVFILPLIGSVALFYLPKIKNLKSTKGIWFLTAKGKKLSLVAMLSGLSLTFFFVLANEYFLHSIALFKHGLLSFALLILLILGGAVFMKKKAQASNAEIVQTIGTFIFTSFIALTFVGVVLRGEGMQLIF